MSDSKPLALLIAGKMKKKGGSSSKGGHLDDLEPVADDLIDAVKAGDASRVARALKDAYDVCGASSSDDEDDDSTDEE